MNQHASEFINRELSWLEFNQRVLDEALDSSIPLLERVMFLAITASNMDEFFMVRVGGLQLLQEQNVVSKDPSGMTATEQLDGIKARTEKMVKDQYQCFLNDPFSHLGICRKCGKSKSAEITNLSRSTATI